MPSMTEGGLNPNSFSKLTIDIIILWGRFAIIKLASNDLPYVYFTSFKEKYLITKTTISKI